MPYNIIENLQKLEDSQRNPHVQLQPGSYNIITAWINYGSAKHEYTIARKILRIFVHEDIESFGITGWLEMIDTDNIVRNGPIVGQELLYMAFETAGATEAGLRNFGVDFTKQPLAIHKVDNLDEKKTASGGRAAQAITYRLHFCSPELLRNDRVRVCQTLQGSYSDIIKRVLKDHLKTTKTIEVQQTTDLKHVNIPEMHPFEAIDWMTESSEFLHPNGSTANPFKGRAADFYFYETTRGYKFKPAMHAPSKEISLTLGNAPATPSYVAQMTTSKTFEHQARSETLHIIPTGMFGSKKCEYNTFTKSVKKYQCSYHKALTKEQTSWVNKTPVFNPTNSSDKNRNNEDRTISDFPDSVFMLGINNGGKAISNVNKNPSTGGSNINYPWSITPPDMDMRRQMQTVHACDYNLLIARFYGISALEAGMVVKLELPDAGTASGHQGGAPIFINRDNNSWIIKQLTHVIDNTQGEGNGYYCDVVLSNTLRDTTKALPSYDGSGSEQSRFRTPTESKIIETDGGGETTSTFKASEVYVVEGEADARS